MNNIIDNDQPPPYSLVCDKYQYEQKSTAVVPKRTRQVEQEQHLSPETRQVQPSSIDPYDNTSISYNQNRATVDGKMKQKTDLSIESGVQLKVTSNNGSKPRYQQKQRQKILSPIIELKPRPLLSHENLYCASNQIQTQSHVLHASPFNWYQYQQPISQKQPQYTNVAIVQNYAIPETTQRSARPALTPIFWTSQHEQQKTALRHFNLEPRLTQESQVSWNLQNAKVTTLQRYVNTELRPSQEPFLSHLAKVCEKTIVSRDINILMDDIKLSATNELKKLVDEGHSKILQKLDNISQKK
jgi:hypothetical protein